MTTVAAEVKNIRRLLQDEPLTDTLAAAIVADSTTTMTVTDVTKHAVGTWWEFDDDTGDKVLETDINTGTSVVTIRRAYRGSSGDAHANGAVLAKQPRFEFDTVEQAINTVLDIDLYGEGIYDLTEHQVTSLTDTTYYNAPATTCREFKDVYQFTSDMTSPHRDGIRYSPKPQNADTTLFSNGKYFVIEGNLGVPGTDLFYVTCAHKHTITSLTEGATRIVQFLAAAYVLEWEEIRRAGGPVNQGDTTVRVGARLPVAAYFRQLAEEQVQKERRTLEDLFPPQKRFVRKASFGLPFGGI